MTVARRVGVSPAPPFSHNLTFGRAGAFACAGVIAALNAQADQLLTAFQHNPLADTLTSLAGISAVIWAAMLAALKLGFNDEPAAISRRDLIVLLGIAGLSLLPISYAAQLGLLLCGSYLLVTSRRDTASRRLSLVLLALTGPLIWGRLLLLAFGAPILALDAHLVGSLIGTEVHGNTVREAVGKGQLLIADRCSSLHNISLAIVLWVTAAALFEVRSDRKYLLVGLAMLAWMFALNVGRLVTIALFPVHYDFFHLGAGASLFGWAALIGAGVLAAAGVLGAVARQG